MAEKIPAGTSTVGPNGYIKIVAEVNNDERVRRSNFKLPENGPLENLYFTIIRIFNKLYIDGIYVNALKLVQLNTDDTVLRYSTFFKRISAIKYQQYSSIAYLSPSHTLD